jgi:hypothetical protein
MQTKYPEKNQLHPARAHRKRKPSVPDLEDLRSFNEEELWTLEQNLCIVTGKHHIPDPNQSVRKAIEAVLAAYHQERSHLSTRDWDDTRSKREINKSIRELDKETLAALQKVLDQVEREARKPSTAYLWTKSHHPTQQKIMKYIQGHTIHPDEAAELCELMDWGNYETVGKSGEIEGKPVAWPFVLFRPDWKLMEKILGVPVRTLRHHFEKLILRGRIKELGFDKELKRGGRKIYAAGHRTAYKRMFFFRG